MIKQYTLTETTLTEGVGGYTFPLTLTFKSADAGRKIELSSDGGVEYFTPTYDVNSATMLNVAVGAPVTNFKVTGAVGDVLTIAWGE